MSDTSQLIELTEDQGVAWITLNRPDKLNSLTADMLQTLQAHVSSISTSDTVRAMVITGAGKAFCAGQDLADIDGADLGAVSYTHLRAHETDSYLVCRLLLEKKKQQEK